ncbi:pleiotropic regulatory locus 1 protein [Nymphaea thermarum]|nr:pleiotropic regulatory locus 1 protein [Nymphaea thermarum]
MVCCNLQSIMVWDVRTKAQSFALSGHENTVCSVFTQAVDFLDNATLEAVPIRVVKRQIGVMMLLFNYGY